MPDEPIAGETPPALDTTTIHESAPEPATPPPPDPSALSDAELIAEANRRQHLFQAPQPETPQADPRLQQIVDLQFSDPIAAENLRMQIAEERAHKRVMTEIAPRLGPMVQDNTIQSAATKAGLGEKGKEYLAGIAKTTDLATVMADPQGFDVLTRAAREYEREKTPPPARYESPYSESGPISAADQAIIREAEAAFGKLEPEAINAWRKERASA